MPCPPCVTKWHCINIKKEQKTRIVHKRFRLDKLQLVEHSGCTQYTLFLPEWSIITTIASPPP